MSATSPITNNQTVELPKELAETQTSLFETDAAAPTTTQQRMNPQLLRTDGGTQTRTELNDEAVDEYAKAMCAGAMFPVAVAFYDGTDYWTADGFHRRAAAIKAGVELDVEIRQGTRRDAILFSVGANARHGLRRTNDDKRRAVETLLRDEDWAKWSNRKVAELCGVTHQFVGDVREQLSGKRSQMAATAERDGKTYTVNTEKIGSKQKSKPSVEVTPEVEAAPAASSPPKATNPQAKEAVAAAAVPVVPEAAPDPEGWSSAQIMLTLNFKPGKSLTRTVLVGARSRADGVPILRNVTAAEIEPLPPALVAIINDLKAAFAGPARTAEAVINKQAQTTAAKKPAAPNAKRSAQGAATNPK